MDILEKRSAKRLKINLPVSYELKGVRREFGDSVSRDISTTGLRMDMSSFLPPASSLFIRLRFPDVNKIVEGTAKIIWSQRISFSDRYQAGLHFNEMSPIYSKWLEEYILIHGVLGK